MSKSLCWFFSFSGSLWISDQQLTQMYQMTFIFLLVSIFLKKHVLVFMVNSDGITVKEISNYFAAAWSSLTVETLAVTKSLTSLKIREYKWACSLNDSMHMLEKNNSSWLSQTAVAWWHRCLTLIFAPGNADAREKWKRISWGGFRNCRRRTGNGLSRYYQC